MDLSQQIEIAVLAAANPGKVAHAQRFFKTGRGEYGEGDQFLGLDVPIQRQIAKAFAAQASLDDIHRLLSRPWHELRMMGLAIMTYQYPKLDEKGKKKYYQFYLDHASRINNWDLVDVSAPHIVGDWLFHHPKERKILKQLVSSKNLWERRIAVLATYPMIKAGQFKEIFELAKKLLADQEDLMHKATGWMLREVSKKDLVTFLKFFDQNYQLMPRTMLRYAIEKLPEKQRKFYLLKKINSAQ